MYWRLPLLDIIIKSQMGHNDVHRRKVLVDTLKDFSFQIWDELATIMNFAGINGKKTFDEAYTIAS